MFLIRTAFWLTLIILLLPANEQQQRDVYGTAGAAVRDLKTFCVRNPDVCQKSSSLLDTFTEKAQFGAKMVMSFVKEASTDDKNVPSDSNRTARSRSPLDRRSGDTNDQNTLTESDLAPAWNGPETEPGV